MTAVLAYLDCFSGVSGDKLLAGLVDAGADPDAVADALGGLAIDGWELAFEQVESGGIAATRAVVTTSDDQPSRTWRDIRALLDSAQLDEDTAVLSLAAFTLLAQAEARVHGVPVEDVHFHEVGAVDSIVDVVGTMAAAVSLALDELVSSPIPTGSGSVETSHGILPVPAPATAELLVGVPTYAGDVASELTTPTGAALVQTLADGFGPMPALTARAVGYGAGTRELPIPNVLRVVVGDRLAVGGTDQVVECRSVVDHVTPEQVAFAMEELLDAGALDAWQTPVVMKKGRAAVEITVLCPPGDDDKLAATLMDLTGTLGIRRSLVDRVVAEREVRTFETSLGEVRFKVAAVGERLSARPEYEDCARLARATGLSVEEVARRLTDEAAGLL
jgi:uncharacterized protein (TIGR00299 family) protein